MPLYRKQQRPVAGKSEDSVKGGDQVHVHVADKVVAHVAVAVVVNAHVAVAVAVNVRRLDRSGFRGV